MSYLFPLETLIRLLKTEPVYRTYAFAAAGTLAVLAALVVLYFRKYFTIVSKSLMRNMLRTFLSSLATMVLVFVVTLILSVLFFLDLVTSEKAQNLKAIVTERYQIPSQMPFSYAAGLEQGAARSERPDDVRPEDNMTWQFFGGSMSDDPKQRTFENSVFAFAMDPKKARTMMDDLESLDAGLIDKMVQNKRGVLMGQEVLAKVNKKVGERFTLYGLNYKDIDLEFEIVGLLPEGRYNQSTIMNRDYLNDALDAFPRNAKNKTGDKHPMAQKTLNLVWLRVPDSGAFQKVADQVMTSPFYSSPSVKCETASSGIASFLDAYRDLLWAAKWVLVPVILITMALVIANAISISVRERRTEMAVLKVLGFSPGRIMGLVLGEALLVGCLSGFLSAALTYLIITVKMGGLKFPIAFFPTFTIWADSMWWGLVCGGLTSLLGSIVPAWSARRVKVSEVFSKVG
jgi:putative ABC transport system permease protein